MIEKTETKLKKTLDIILIYNLYIIIFGAIFFLISILSSINGSTKLYNLFEILWFPIFIPSLSLFFTAILIEAILSNIKNKDL
tara:strand:- start:215 stop:463 length:249 start_codon:yes stop_codon:yes gene_type:complete